MCTGDLFNLFVTFEVMLIGSYVLLTLRGGRRQVRAGAIYVTVSLLASTIFLVGIGHLYGTAGTVAFAAVPRRRRPSPRRPPSARALIVVAIAVKAALVPLHTWLPRTYVEAGPGVTALFSGLLTKAGVYVLFRLSSILFAGGDGTSHRLWIAVAALTMVVGVLGAVGRADMRGILVVPHGQPGRLPDPAAGAVERGRTHRRHRLPHAVRAGEGRAVRRRRHRRDPDGTGKLARTRRDGPDTAWLAVAFLFPALALAGIPPTSGFVGKYLLIRAAFIDAHWVAGGVAVLVSLFTLLSMVKIWNGAFWGELTERSRSEPAPLRLGPAAGAGRRGR